MKAAVLFLLFGLPLASEGPSLLGSVLRTVFALVGVCALAFVVLSWLARRGIGVSGRSRSGRIEVIERVTLAPRTSLYVIRVDGRELLVGSGESGSLALITELGVGRESEGDALGRSQAAPAPAPSSESEGG